MNPRRYVSTSSNRWRVIHDGVSVSPDTTEPGPTIDRFVRTAPVGESWTWGEVPVWDGDAGAFTTWAEWVPFVAPVPHGWSTP